MGFKLSNFYNKLLNLYKVYIRCVTKKGKGLHIYGNSALHLLSILFCQT
jgi:hypothetical protein